MPALESVPDSEVRENSGQTTIPATAIADIIPDNIAIQRVVNSFKFFKPRSASTRSARFLIKHNTSNRKANTISQSYQKYTRWTSFYASNI